MTPIKKYLSKLSDGGWVKISNAITDKYPRRDIKKALSDMGGSSNFTVMIEGSLRHSDFQFMIIELENASCIDMAKKRKKGGITKGIESFPIIITNTERLKVKKTMRTIADKYCGRRQAAVMREVNHPKIRARADTLREIEKLKEPNNFDYSLEAELERLLKEEGVKAA